MLKKTIKETVNEYNEQGALVKQTITETSEYDGVYDTTIGTWREPTITWASSQTSAIKENG